MSIFNIISSEFNKFDLDVIKAFSYKCFNTVSKQLVINDLFQETLNFSDIDTSDKVH
jgi:predicted YcjX-like family ATPase